MLWLFLLPLLAADFSSGAGNEKIRNFRAAKKLALEVHLEHPYTIYCGCRYEGKKIDLQSCGYV
jgi:deoxyribonuclease-1